MQGEYPDYAHVDTKEHILPQGFDKNREWKEYLSKEYQANPWLSKRIRKPFAYHRQFDAGRKVKRNSALQNDIFPKKLERIWVQYWPFQGLDWEL